MLHQWLVTSPLRRETLLQFLIGVLEGLHLELSLFSLLAFCCGWYVALWTFLFHFYDYNHRYPAGLYEDTERETYTRV